MSALVAILVGVVLYVLFLALCGYVVAKIDPNRRPSGKGE